MVYNSWAEELEKNYEETVEWRRYLHKNPEPSFEEKGTAKFIIKKLQEFGIEEIQTNVGNGYGIVAKIKGDQPGPTVALRADFDALRVGEETDVAFKSTNDEVMHACGHDGHTANLLSVAKVMQNHRDQLHGNIVLIFQNAEEVHPGGAKSMVEAGALDGVDYIFGIHLEATKPLNQINYTTDYSSANSDRFQLSIQGKGGHGASPHETHDALTIAAQIVTSTQQLVSRLTDPVKPAVVSFGAFKAGGEAYNIIADQAKLAGTVRTLHPDVRDKIELKLRSISSNIAEAFDAHIELDYKRGYPSIKNDVEQVERTVEKFKQVFDETDLNRWDGNMYGEDFAYYLKERPGAFYMIGAAHEKQSQVFPHHHPKFSIDERALLRSGQVFLAIIDEYLGDSN